MEFGWRIVVGTLIGILGAACGSVGGVGGGGIFVPMLILIIGFDPKSAIAISKFTSIRAFFKGAETWKKETIMKEETAKLLESTATCSVEEKDNYKYLPGSPDGGPEMETRKHEVSLLGNIYWKEFVLIFCVWLVYVVLEIYKGYTVSCSITYWILILSQVYHNTNYISSATATFGMMYSSSLSVVQYYLLNRFPVPYALLLTLVAAIAAFLGQHLIDKLVNIFQRASLIIFILAFTIFVMQLH
uniref:Sulfite exporter TauE/SafE family protein 3 n=1 Tax=Cajanus cajan TaxID=3821 RepID=A0A151SFL9_CAJCA|nr:hypothetical protein KK1_024478 [Cajanus cajan]